MEIERDIAGHLVIEKGRARGIGQRRLADGRQRVDIDDNGFSRILRGGDGLGDDCGQPLPDMAHLVGGERMAHRAKHRRPVAIVHDLARRQRADPTLGQIRRGIDRQDARHRTRGARVDALDHAMGIGAAQHHRVSLPRQADIV